MLIETTARRFLAALLCTTVMGAAAWADDVAPAVEEVAVEEGTELVDPAPEENPEIYETGVVEEGETLVGDPGEEVVEDGEPVSYGPDDCIDCNVGITSVGGEARGGSEVERGGFGNDEVSRSDGGTSSQPQCSSLKPLDMTPCEQ